VPALEQFRDDPEFALNISPEELTGALSFSCHLQGV